VAKARRKRYKYDLSGGGAFSLLKKAFRYSGGEEPSTLSRVSFQDLEDMKMSEPIAYAGVEHWVTALRATWNPHGLAFSNREDKKSMKRVWEILTSPWFKRYFFSYAPRQLATFGNSWVELVFNDNMTFLHRLIVHKPQTMDFILDDYGNTYFDDITGEPLGFYQESVTKDQDAGLTIVFQNIEITEGEDFDWRFTAEELDADKRGVCMHLKMGEMQRGEMGVGLLEPVYQDMKNKEDMEDAKKNSAVKKGFPVPIATYGDDVHDPNAKLDNVAERIAKLAADPKTSYIMKPYWIQLETLEDKLQKGYTDDTQQMLEYYNKLQAAVFMIPLDVLLQTGGKGI